ncbi:hypothetical protein NC652_031359 [Populus alba x Populus x berolinensis]|nr:hypothetical protein NC652_031359 [Populus alba x Populus x berolinensis]
MLFIHIVLTRPSIATIFCNRKDAPWNCSNIMDATRSFCNASNHKNWHSLIISSFCRSWN